MIQKIFKKGGRSLKKLGSYFCVMSAMLLLISCAGGSKTEKKDKAINIAEHFELGFRAAEKGNLEEAIFEYQSVLKLDPKHSRAHLNLGIA